MKMPFEGVSTTATTTEDTITINFVFSCFFCLSKIGFSLYLSMDSKELKLGMGLIKDDNLTRKSICPWVNS